MNEDDRYTRITLRIPRELHARLDIEADNTSKSLNAEIIARLQSSFASSAVTDQRLQWEVESLKRIDVISTATSQALATYIVTMHEHLPQKLRKEMNSAIAYRLALSLLKRDGAGLADVFGDLFADDLTVVAEMHRIKDEFSKGHPNTIAVRDTPVKKVVLVGNLGRDTSMGGATITKTQPNKGPAKRTRNRPPK